MTGPLVLLLALTAMAEAVPSSACSPSPCTLDAVLEPGAAVSMERQSYTVISLQTNLTDDAVNVTVSVEVEDTKLVYADSPAVTHEVDTGMLLANITVSGGKKYGTTKVDIKVSWWSDGEMAVAVFKKVVIVTRPPSKVSTQKALEYLIMGMSLTVALLAGCQTTFSDIKRWTPYITIAILIQCILSPMICMALLDLFFVRIVAKMGIMSVINGPASLLAIPFAALVDADVGLAAVLIISHYLLANAVLPLWILQYRRFDDSLTMSTDDVPYVGMCVLFAIGSLLLLMGMVIKHYQASFAQILAKITLPLSAVAVLVGVITGIYGGADLLGSLDWRSGLPGALWPLIAIFLMIVAVVLSNNPGPAARACAAFLLIKSMYVPYEMAESAYEPPLLEMAVVPAYFLSLVTLLCGSVVALGYRAYYCFVRSAYDDMDRKLVVQVDPEEELNAPVTDSPLSGAEYGVENKRANYGEDDDMVGAMVSAGSMGIPVSSVF